MKKAATIPFHTLTVSQQHGQPFRMIPLRDYLKGNTDFVHRHNFYELIWVQRGVGTHQIDFTTHTLQDKTLFFLTPGQVHYLHDQQAVIEQASILIFNEEFIYQGDTDRELLSSLTLLPAWDQHTQTVQPPDATPLEHLIALMDAEYHLPNRNYELLRSALRILLILTVRHRTTVALSAGDLNTRRLNAFRTLVETQFATHHQAPPYAGQLALSLKRLDQICRQLTGKSAQRLIHERIVVEAKRLIAYHQASVKEVAFQIGFDDPSYFSRFFRRMTGVSPQSFREQFPNSTRH